LHDNCTILRMTGKSYLSVPGLVLLYFAVSISALAQPMLSTRASSAAVQASSAVQGKGQASKDGAMWKIGYDLALLHFEHIEFSTAAQPGPFKSSNQLLRLRNDSVLVDAVAAGGAKTLESTLRQLGMQQVSVHGRYVSGFLPIGALAKAAALTDLQFARAALATKSEGAVTSQGDIAQASDLARSNFAVNGGGVVVGTLSDSYNCKGGAASDVAGGDLPAGVTVLQDEVGCASGTDEGRAMMQIVHDVAPGATQAFYTAFGGTADFANGIIALATTANASVINDDVLYYAEPMFQDGVIAQAVDTVKGMGVAYFSAAGNSARKSYESVFRNSGVKGLAPRSIRHDFDSGTGTDTLMQVTIPANTQVIFVLQWDDPFYSVSGTPGADTDMDMIIYSAGGQALTGGTDNNIRGDAVEVFAYTNTSSSAASYQIAIERVKGPDPGKIKFVYFSNMTINEYATNSSTSYGHPIASGARAVGAARYSSTPAYGVSPPAAESYSSYGGLEILFDSAGNSINDLRQKPEIVAPDGGDTTFFGSDNDGNGYPNFLGTSAAAPHAAGAAALLKSFISTLTPDDIYQALQSTAIDMGPAGFDYRTGYGLIQVDQALAYFDADADGVLNSNDNCPVIANADQLDNDSDGLGDACDPDDDNDGLSDAEETILGTNPFLQDSDSDTLLDGDEVHLYFTDPLLQDSDSDGYEDNVEVSAGSDPNSATSIPGAGSGDVNGDGIVDVRDLLLMQQFVLGISVAGTDQRLRADIAPLSAGLPSPDGVLNAADYAILQRVVLGEISIVP
jgi:hypothetical protein